MISIVASASKPQNKNDLSEAMKFYKTLGYQVVAPKDMISEEHPFHANTDEYRLKHLYKSLLLPITWCLRGGYGSTKLLPKLAKKKALPAKHFIGFSDITALHVFLNQEWGWKTIHGCHVASPVKQDKYNIKNFELVRDLIAGKLKKIVFDDIKQMNQVKFATPIKATVVGGNLAIIESLIGTPWQLKTAGKILVLEDIDERGYSIDRSLNHLKQSGMFAKVKAVVFGEFLGSKESDGKDFADFVLTSFAAESKFPVFKTNLIGHGYNNYPFIIGGKGELTKSKFISGF